MDFETNSVVSFVKKPLFLLVLFGLLIRFVLIPLTYEFDIYHWAMTISNINSGHNLYDLDGYYYTPIWGYLLGFISSISEFFTNGLLGMRLTEFLPIEDLLYPNHIATITTIAFSFVMKIPIIVCDLVVGYLVYWLIRDRTGDTKKATIGFGLWFFCPIVIYMSGIQAQFDSFSALFTMLSIILLYKDKYFLGGAMLSLAVLLKFFPGFCILVVFAYILVKHKDDGLGKRKLLEMMLGISVMSIIILLPIILNGQLDSMLSFITGRTGGSLISLTIINTIIAIIMAFFFAYKMLHTPKEDADRKMFIYVLFALVGATLMSAVPQYIIVMIPFLILHIMSEERCYIRCWVILSVVALISAFSFNNLSLLCSLAAYTGLASPEWIMSSMQFLDTGMGFNLILLFYTLSLIQYVATLLILIFYFADAINKKNPTIGKFILRLKYGRHYNEA